MTVGPGDGRAGAHRRPALARRISLFLGRRPGATRRRPSALRRRWTEARKRTALCTARLAPRGARLAGYVANLAGPRRRAWTRYEWWRVRLRRGRQDLGRNLGQDLREDLREDRREDRRQEFMGGRWETGAFLRRARAVVGRSTVVGRVLPGALGFVVVLSALAVFHPDLRQALGTAPGSPRSGAATHPLYDVSAASGASCVLPEDRDADRLGTLRSLAGCLDWFWMVTLGRAGHEYSTPEVRLVESSREAACGTGDPGWAGIYCPRSRTVNVLVRQDWTFSMMFTLAHEYAHHVQEITGIAAQDGPEIFDEAWSRRLELQADCLAALALRDIDPASLSGLRRFAVEAESLVPEQQTHGSARNGAAWMAKGEQATVVGACNTWSAAADDVS